MSLNGATQVNSGFKLVSRLHAVRAMRRTELATSSATRAPRRTASPIIRGLLVCLAVVIVSLELRRPLRKRYNEPKARRAVRNLAVGGLAAATVQLLEQPLVLPVSCAAERHRWGLLPRLPLPSWLKTMLAIVALDYTLYIWHVLVHRVPALWRFHAVHHVDLDLDASTAIRFHFGELIASIPWRAAQVCAIGVPPRTLLQWQGLTLMSVIFHHSNLRLPVRIERLVGLVLVTPRMHGIHHSVEPSEVNSNWSSGLSIWDRLHGTLRLDVPQDCIEIGVEGFTDPSQVTLPKILAQPFTRHQASGIRRQ